MSSNAKIELYRFIGDMRKKYPLLCYSKNKNIEEFCLDNNIELHLKKFDSKGLCGAAFVGEKHDTIILNSCRSKSEMTFDFIHELIHTKKHRNTDKQAFACFDRKQNSYIEWEANEGAAEFLVPYKLFLPIIKENYNKINSQVFGAFQFCEETAGLFNVSNAVITNRLDNLKYEIYQYLNGTPLEHVKILSLSEQRKQGIIVKSLIEIEDERFKQLYSRREQIGNQYNNSVSF